MGFHWGEISPPEEVELFGAYIWWLWAAESNLIQVQEPPTGYWEAAEMRWYVTSWGLD